MGMPRSYGQSFADRRPTHHILLRYHGSSFRAERTRSVSLRPGPGPRAPGPRRKLAAQGACGLVAVAPREKGICTVACMRRRRHKTCIDCHKCFKSSSLLLDRRIGAPATDTFLTGRPGSGRGSRGLGPGPGPWGPGPGNERPNRIGVERPNCRIQLRQPRMVHTFTQGWCSCSDRWRWESRLAAKARSTPLLAE